MSSDTAMGRDPREVLAGMTSWGPPGRHLITSQDAATLMGVALVHLGQRRLADGPYAPATFRSAVGRAITQDEYLAKALRHSGPAGTVLWDGNALLEWIAHRPGSGAHGEDVARVATPPGRISGEELRQIRRSMGLTQKEIAARLGMSKAQYGYWEQSREVTPANLADRLENLPDEPPPPAQEVERMSGAQIQDFRTARYMTQPEFAEALGVSPSTVWHWEKERVRPPADLPQRLAELPAAIVPMSGAAIRAVRKALGMSYGSLAAALDVHPDTVSGWEKERSRPPADLRERLTALTDAAL